MDKQLIINAIACLNASMDAFNRAGMQDAKDEIKDTILILSRKLKD